MKRNRLHWKGGAVIAGRTKKKKIEKAIHAVAACLKGFLEKQSEKGGFQFVHARAKPIRKGGEKLTTKILKGIEGPQKGKEREPPSDCWSDSKTVLKRVRARLRHIGGRERFLGTAKKKKKKQTDTSN